MRSFTELFAVNGKPLLAPDEGVQIHYEDIDGAAAGRDQRGFMHRRMVRCKVPNWSFTYSHLTEQERQYMESLFGDSATFTFTHPDRLSGEAAQTECYRSKCAIQWKSAVTGLWSGYSFTVIAL